MSYTILSRHALAVAVFALAACGGRDEPRDPRLSQPLPPPGPISPVNQAAGLQQSGQPQDAVLRGAAYAETGDGRFPPDSRMIVRVYDDAKGESSAPVAEQSYTRSGSLPWPYELRVPLETMSAASRPVLSARIEGPRGELIYRSAKAVILEPGGSDDIPLVPVTGGGVAAATPVPTELEAAPVQRTAESIYGIPDYDASYGTPNYDTPVYPGQTFGSPSLSGPPSNTTY